MTIRDEMRAAAARSRDVLGTSRSHTVSFLMDHFVGGGFCGRDGAPDLYYTVFGLESLAALDIEAPPSVAEYLRGFDSGASLDVVHAASLARCRAAIPAGAWSPHVRSGLAARIVELAGDHATVATAYGCFLATGALQDTDQPLPRDHLLSHLTALRATGGGFGNHPDIGLAATSATAAAIVTLAHMGAGPQQEDIDWLTDQHTAAGGFRAVPGVPAPDLLSTATALHALAVAGASLDALRGPCRAFALRLRRDSGGFCAGDDDPTADVEYTYYGLLALGHTAG